MGGEGGDEDEWVNDALRYRRPSYVHSGPDRWPQHPSLYKRADVQQNRIEPQATLLMPLKGLTGSIMVLYDLTGSTTSRL